MTKKTKKVSNVTHINREASLQASYAMLNQFVDAQIALGVDVTDLISVLAVKVGTLVKNEYYHPQQRVLVLHEVNEAVRSAALEGIVK